MTELVQGVKQRPDSSHTALAAAGLAIALGGAALFAIVAHTRTPFFQMMGTAPPDFASAPRPLDAARSAELDFAPRLLKPIAPEPRMAELHTAEVAPASAPPAEPLPIRNAVDTM